MLEIWVENFDKSTSLKDKVTLLHSSSTLRLFRSPNADALEKVASKIKLLFEDVNTRFEGLILMQALVSDCPDVFFQEKCIAWGGDLLRILQGTDSCDCKEVACRVFVNILVKSVKTTSRRQVGEKLVPEILSVILQVEAEDQWIVAVLNLLAVCLKYLPEFCVQYKVKIEELLINQLDSTSSSLINSVSECFCYLPNVVEMCSSSTLKQTYSKQWTDQLNRMMGSLNDTFNFLYSDFYTEESFQLPVSLQLPPECEQPSSAIPTAARRYQAIARVVTKMLSTETCTDVRLPINRLLRVISRALAMTYQLLPTETLLHGEVSLLVFVLPIIHASALSILEALIRSVPNCLFVEEVEISSLLVHALSIQSFSCGDQKITCKLLRAAVYRVLRLWVDMLQPLSIESCIEKLCHDDLLEDINPVKFESLTKEMNAVKEESKMAADITACAEEALGLLISLMSASNHQYFTEEGFLSGLQSCVVDVLVHVQQSDVLPYINGQSRYHLYKLLLHTVLHSHQAQSTPLCPAMHIFQKGEQDSFIEVSRFCREAISSCLTITQPERTYRKKILNIPVESPQVPVSSQNMVSNIPVVKPKPTSEWDAVDANEISEVPNKVIQDIRSPGKSPDIPDEKPDLNPMVDNMQKRNDHLTKMKEDVYDIDEEWDDNEEEEEEEDEEMDEEEYSDMNQYEEEDEEEPHIEEEEIEEVGEPSEPSDAMEMDGEDISHLEEKEERSEEPPKPSTEDSNVNGLPGGEVINENGFDSSNEGSQSDLPRKRPRLESAEEAPASAPESVPSTSKAASIEAPESSASADVPSESVESMIKDFVPCSPERKS